MNRTGSRNRLFRFFMAVLIILFAAGLFMLAAELGEWNHGKSAYQYSELQKCAEKRDYPELISMLAYNEIYGLKTEKDTAEFSTLAEYYENAMLYHAYEKNGDAEITEEYAEKLDVLLNGMNDEDIIKAAEAIRTYGIH